ncbi:3-beta hydroxysteroid dehydrogenase [Subtercola sp. Z020]|uniref:SDR family oxidoreductase n=1 Tax=Subtercola sp. Z020 TaxID=2080582 RepID=UPI000CE7EA5E|nr:NAD(P)H-binding protein [Subtercola sp. Z020]PPF89723.1 3-beta hydroxysteroid dehydrogenase [Subtercola sp. Z020]
MRIVVAGATGTVGRHVVEAATRHGHDVVPLSRATGQNVVTGRGLDHALRGADAVVDVTSIQTTSAARSRAFFAAGTSALLAAEERCGVRHHIALSIVGVDALPLSYYAGKVQQERLVEAADVPHSILRATQFHEFADQILARGAVGPLALVPTGLLRPVAALDVAEALVAIAEAPAPASGRHPDLRGPQDETLLAMVRAVAERRGSRRRVVGVSLPGAYWRGMRSGLLRGDGAATEGRVTFAEWLAAQGPGGGSV